MRITYNVIRITYNEILLLLASYMILSVCFKAIVYLRYYCFKWRIIFLASLVQSSRISSNLDLYSVP